MAKEQRGIQSIDVGGRLLQALTRSDGAMMLKDLAEAADMPPAKAHAYLVSFLQTGPDGAGRRHRPLRFGSTGAGIGVGESQSSRCGQIAQRGDVGASRPHWSVHGRRRVGNYGPTIVRFEQSVRPIHVNMRTGTAMQLHPRRQRRPRFAAHVTAVQRATL